MSATIEALRLSRFYGMVLGLNNVSFEVRPGLTGVIGPNGAGKTTLFRLLTGQIRASSGSLRVFGANPWNNPAVRARVGYCPEGEAVPAGLGAASWVSGLGMLSGLPARVARERAAECLTRVRLGEAHWRKPLTSLSKGMRQRVKLAQTLIHDPDLFIFDEPMNGLDPMGREEFADVLRELALAGKTILISSHILQDLEALCASFLLLRGGRIPVALNETLAAGARKAWPASTTIRCEDPAALVRYLLQRDLVRGWDLGDDPGVVHIRWKDPERFFADFAGILLGSGVPIGEVRDTESALQHALEPGGGS